MGNLEDPLKKELFETDDEFRTLYEQHQELECRLQVLSVQSLLSEEDELEEKQLKRQKLFLKDRMEAIVRAHRTTQVSA
jgi:uncharacterized protein YdcH (DUF465 family)